MHNFFFIYILTLIQAVVLRSKGMNELEPHKYQPTVIIKFNQKTSDIGKQWLLERITNDKHDGGCQLDVEVEEDLFFVTASIFRLLHGAEEFGFKKEYKDGSVREFCFADGSNFKNFNDDMFLLESECHRIMKNELYGLRASDETHIPGHPKVKLYPGKSIFRRMESNELISDCFPLHNRGALSKLRVKWYKNYQVSFLKPIEAIHEYFGDTVGIYFNFLNFYTVGLLPLVFLSVCHLCLSTSEGVVSNWGLSITNIVWSTILMELWKRKSCLCCYKWGSYGLNESEEPRAGFRGALGVNEVSNKPEPVYPSWKRKIRIYLISFPIIALCISLAVALMFYYFSWEVYLTELYDEEDTFTSKLLKNTPSILYSILIYVANYAYRHLADYLTEQENHRLESTFQNYLITKILLFDFANNFLCLFYIAFVYDDMSMLRTTLRNLLLVHLLISQALESLLPYWMYKYRSSSLRVKLNQSKGFISSDMVLEEAKISRQEQARLELQRSEYSGTFDDYLELWLQFGYVVLFSCVYPQAAIFAFLNNIVEERSDAFKMCNVVRRPFAYQTCGIGAWEIAFQALSYLAIVSNLALIFHTNAFLVSIHNFEPIITNVKIVFLFFCLEHILLGMRWLISMAIPDVPQRVRVEIARLQYWSLQALKQQRSLLIRRASIASR